MEPLKNLSDDYTIVVIEGSKFCRKNIQLLLDKYFKNVFICHNWKDGFKRMQINTPNILIADVNSHGKEGLELIKKIKNIDHNIEIIVISATIDTTNLLEALHIGVTDFIPKPINYNLLSKALQKGLNSLKDNRNVNVEQSDKNRTIYDIFEDIKNSKSNLEFINYYKGVPIIRSGKIVKVENGKVEAEVDPLQLKAIAFEKFTSLEVPSLDKSFVAKAVNINQTASTIILTQVKQLEYSPKRRIFVRVVPDENFHMVVLKGNKKYNVTMNDISAKSLSFNVDKDKTEFEVDEEITLNMSITPKNKIEKTKSIIKSNAKIYQSYPTPKGLCVVAAFELESDKLQTSLNEYIYERELEIIEEFKHLKLRSKKKAE